MRNAFFSICTILIICAACKSSPTPAENPKQEDIKPDHSSDRNYIWGNQEYVDLARRQLLFYSENKMEEMAALLSDSIHFAWNGGHEFTGKDWTVNYLRHRRNKLIDTIYYTDQFWMPVEIKLPAYQGQRTGQYVYAWTTLHVKYENGKMVNERIHLEYHFDNQKRIDDIMQYIDRVPLLEAGGE